MNKEQILERVKINKKGCWVWQKSLNRKGYGQASHEGRVIGAHRISYFLFKGKLIAGLELDHLCRNRACVNPEHLEQVTGRENILRGQSSAAVNARKKRCKFGHLLSGENLYMDKRGYRNCKKCRARNSREHHFTKRRPARRLLRGHK